MTFKQKYGNTAMVAGASEGIGAAFASSLAAKGLDLVIVARRLHPLQQLAISLERTYKVNVKCFSLDLSLPDAALEIEKALNGLEINVLIYNAALSRIGPFLENTPEDLSHITQVNMITPLHMVRRLGESMVRKGKGAIVLMTSLAGLQGSGNLSVYAATKAFSRILAESLWYEWKNSGVDIIACCAGATATPGYINSHPEKTGFFTPRVLHAEEVPQECFRKLGKQPSCIAGRANRIASFIMQNVMSRKMAVTIMGDTTQKMYKL